MDNTVRKLNIDNTDYNFPQGFPIIAGYSSYGRSEIDLTQSFTLPFSTQYFGFSDTFPRYASTITAEEAKTEIKKYRPLIFKWDWYDTESSRSEHIITAELYPLYSDLSSFMAEVPITVHRLGVTTTYISRINISLLSNTFSYTYITTIPDDLNNMSDIAITTPIAGDALIYDSNTSKWVNSPIPHFDIDMNDVEEGQIIQYSSKVNAFVSAEVKNTIDELYNESTGTLETTNDLNYYLRYKAQHPIFNLAVSNGSNIRGVPAAICAHYLSITGASGDVTALMAAYTEDSSVIADPTIKFYIDCYFMRDPSTMKKLVLSLSVANPTMTVESYTTVTDIFS